jgi:hypothetical protein
MLRKQYGEMIIKEGSILYHTSDNKFKYKDDKPMLFCTFHPSEYTGNNKYLHYVKIKKDISLLFMISDIKDIKIYSALNDLIEHPNKNLAKKHDYILKILEIDLKKENFDGWFSSIENKANVEVALNNNKDRYYVLYDGFSSYVTTNDFQLEAGGGKWMQTVCESFGPCIVAFGGINVVSGNTNVTRNRNGTNRLNLNNGMVRFYY